ncbi:hypothetical protein QTQ03_26540 [Micromonospora sp. WMMA1363]|uniref:hypothetical protein n=1 Tax=Micromonospora sp. WMMA1363 TaxID=3053985 RepID=UPI00259CE16B|nr:hypothetical protein [Micromonospora sp. WMMA1363]MDM4720127.1 hypothetical protein [Micromonospora sp. WMMA1363]MDM4721352.1 hypothetical protein [Micromonospora sp. WMMA1363]MDM4722987.1 hypothetical protein [Micromonospora sp. WMMA1363]
MGRTNRASGNDRVAVQAGQVFGRRDTGSKTPKDTSDTTPGRTENIRAGRATVGRQADEIRGGLTIR